MNGFISLLKAIITWYVGSAKASQVEEKKKETPKPTEKPVMKPLFKNDSPRLVEEYNGLANKNPGLLSLLNSVADYSQQHFGKNVVITMIYRTEAEQEEIYKNDPKYQQRKFKSPHQLYHAFDLRSKTFTDDQINNLVNWINSSYNATNTYAWTAKCHDIGLGEHFHVQYCKKG